MAAKYPHDDSNEYNQRLADVALEPCEMLMPIQGYETQPLVSLEEAIEPIVSFVPDVKRMAFVAKRKCKTTPPNNLSVDESASIILYSMEWEPQDNCLYYVFNQTLRNKQRKKLKPWFLYLKLILTALSRLPSSHRFVFRGVKADMKKHYQEGATIYWWGFSSCTTNIGVLQNETFVGKSGVRTIFTIECFNGKDIREHSDFYDEAEILLLPGRQFKVVGCLDQGNNLYMIQLKEIEPDYPLLEPILSASHQSPDADKISISTAKLTDRIMVNSNAVKQNKSDASNQWATTYNPLSDHLTKYSSKLADKTQFCKSKLPEPSKPLIQEKNDEKMPSVTKKLNKLSVKDLPIDSPKQNINILLLSQTGVGRSTFINALANYLVSDTLEQAVNDQMQVLIPVYFSFTDQDTFDERTISIGQQDEYENWDDKGETCTKKCRSFVFTIGDRLLRLIETPPVEDTRGVEQSMKNIDEIINYIARYEYLNGICILFKPNEGRLNILFQYSLAALLRQLSTSAITNVMFVITNARATFFDPGSTDIVLRQLFDIYHQEHNIEIPFTKENTFLVDNEGFRYLASHKRGIRLDDDRTLSYIESWDFTIKEYARLITYITTRPACLVRDIVSLYRVQHTISILTHLFYQTSKYMKQSIQLVREYQKSICSNTQNFSKKMSQHDVYILFLKHPQLVCTNSERTGSIIINGVPMTQYKSVCCDRFYATGDTIGHLNHPAIKTCHIMDQETGKCTKCHCSWDEHMSIIYKYQRTLTDINLTTEQYIENQTIFCLDLMDEYISSAREEKRKIEDVYKKLCKFVQVNAVLPFNELLPDYVNYWIREELMKRSFGTQNDDIIKDLEMLCSNYQNEIDLIKKTIENERSSGNITELIKAKDIYPLAATLYTLPINGQKIRNQVDQLLNNQTIIENQENFVKLPPKANSSKLMIQLKETMSKS